MGGAFSKKKDKTPERQNPSDTRNRRLSVTGDKQQFPSGDSNVVRMPASAAPQFRDPLGI
jgi:hypothetical protein